MAKANKRSLGRGLDALIPETGGGGEEGVQEIEVYQIVASPYQPRKGFSEESLAELAQSIKEHGIVQPLIVRDTGDGFQLVAGERRLRAAKIAGLKMVPVIIRDVPDSEALEIALIENLQREELNSVEEAEAYQRLCAEFRLTQEQVAARVGKSRSQITNVMRLLQLETRVRDLISDGKISLGHAKVLLGLEDRDLQYHVAREIAENGLSVRETEQLIARIGETRGGKPEAQAKRSDPLVKGLEDRLRTCLGTMVKIKGSAARGSIEIKYYSDEQLDQLMLALLDGESEDTAV